MAVQNALWIPNVGAEFTLGKNKNPEPGPGEVLVKLEAAAINPVDWKIQNEGFFLINKRPTIIGEHLQLAGLCGCHESSFTTSPGRIFASPFDAKYGGTYQQYCLQADAELASEVDLVRIAGVSMLLSFPFTVATYAEDLRGMGFTPPFETVGLGKYANQPIVIMGGAYSVGQYGATHVLDRKLSAHALKDKVTNFVKGPIRYVFEAVSLAETQYAAYNLLAPGGTLAVVAQNFLQEDEARQKKIFIVYESFHIPENRALGVKFATVLTAWLAEGKIIRPNPVQVLPGGLGGIVDGLKELETTGVNAKKLVVRLRETRT